MTHRVETIACPALPFPARNRLPRDHGIPDLDQHDELALLYELRIRADYQEDQVPYEVAADAAEAAARIVRALLGASS
jgi:hypothetical protein